MSFKNSLLDERLDSKPLFLLLYFLRMNTENLEMSLNSHWYSEEFSFRCAKSSSSE